MLENVYETKLPVAEFSPFLLNGTILGSHCCYMVSKTMCIFTDCKLGTINSVNSKCIGQCRCQIFFFNYQRFWIKNEINLITFHFKSIISMNIISSRTKVVHIHQLETSYSSLILHITECHGLIGHFITNINWHIFKGKQINMWFLSSF